MLWVFYVLITAEYEALLIFANILTCKNQKGIMTTEALKDLRARVSALRGYL
ncbi:MAG: hypothetical protein ACI9IP_002579 [Arcticibacterium sp.]|jgi:hypothetical protein